MALFLLHTQNILFRNVDIKGIDTFERNTSTPTPTQIVGIIAMPRWIYYVCIPKILYKTPFEKQSALATQLVGLA